jgi:hypothetical protein
LSGVNVSSDVNAHLAAVLDILNDIRRKAHDSYVRENHSLAGAEPWLRQSVVATSAMQLSTNKVHMLQSISGAIHSPHTRSDGRSSNSSAALIEPVHTKALSVSTDKRETMLPTSERGNPRVSSAVPEQRLGSSPARRHIYRSGTQIIPCSTQHTGLIDR